MQCISRYNRNQKNDEEIVRTIPFVNEHGISIKNQLISKVFKRRQHHRNGVGIKVCLLSLSPTLCFSLICTKKFIILVSRDFLFKHTHSHARTHTDRQRIIKARAKHSQLLLLLLSPVFISHFNFKVTIEKKMAPMMKIF